MLHCNHVTENFEWFWTVLRFELNQNSHWSLFKVFILVRGAANEVGERGFQIFLQ